MSAHVTRLALLSSCALALVPAASLADDVSEVASDAPEFETVITGSRSAVSVDESPVDTLVITRRDIEASGARDVAEALASQPGVELVRDGVSGVGVRLQGLQPEHVLILVDGQRVPGRSRGVIDLSRYAADRVAWIEVVKGPTSSLYGSDAMGGVVNIVTRRDPRRPVEASLQARTDSLGAYELDGSAAVRKGASSALRLAAGLRRSSAFRLVPESVSTSGSSRDELDLEFQGEQALGEGLRVSGSASWLSTDRESVDLGSGGATFDRYDRTRIYSFTLEPRISLGGSGALLLTLHHSRLDNQLLQDQRGSNALDQYQHSVEGLWQGGVQHNVQLGSHRLTSGAELLFEDLESPRLDGGRGDRFRPALFVQDDWVLSGETSLALTPGLRLDHDSRFSTALSPKISARYSPLEELQLRASYGWGFRAPSFQELLLRFENPSAGYVVEGNPDLQPETSRGGSVGASYRATRWLDLSASVFRNDIRQLITSGTIAEGAPGQPARFGYLNVASAITQGVEAGATVRPLRGVSVTAGYQLLDARDLSSDRLLEGRARHNVTLAASWIERQSGLSASARGEWVGERPFYSLEDGSSRVAESHVFASARVAKELGGGFTAFVGAENLFDAGDPEDFAIPPRSIFAGASVRY
ncbi:TonB-dependent receptor plug domain-containing protein [Vulgatibacter incomptus]|uniref:TonB-dependent receptor n=1 Tax=Vulgatibacter incomptus TaxID=1391653 RepID=A0A0K1PBR3_9BACT|nr:TonB-dependent receptor [Vulgatibacter incomptus]AKU90965.1 TonB-dependent receptor [Vulgatibacter incomptus]